MPDLGNSRRKMKIAIGAMLAVDVVAIGRSVLAAGGFGGVAAERRSSNLRAELTKKTHEVAPLRGMPAKDCAGEGLRLATFTKIVLPPKIPT